MDLKSGYPWWAIRNGLPGAFPRLEQDLRCDVAVIGGGVTGALIADEFVRHGHAVVVIEQRDVGWGSTAASTALLQYEIDTPMTELARRYGEADALLAYRACLDAVPMLQAVAAGLRGVGFARSDSLYFASRRRHRSALQEEFALRRKHGFPVEWLEADAVRARHGFDAPCALLSHVAARVDPYRFAWRLLARVQRKGGAVHDRTRIARIGPAPAASTWHRDGIGVRARHLVLACGYASQQWLSAAGRAQQQQLRVRHRPDRRRCARCAAAARCCGKPRVPTCTCAAPTTTA